MSFYDHDASTMLMNIFSGDGLSQIASTIKTASDLPDQCEQIAEEIREYYYDGHDEHFCIYMDNDGYEDHLVWDNSGYVPDNALIDTRYLDVDQMVKLADGEDLLFMVYKALAEERFNLPF